MWTYLILNLGTICFPVALSFDRKVHFLSNWMAAIKAIVPVALFFIAWDIWFTEMGVWGFNHEYLVGWTLLGLPLEELLFFVTVPFACIFIYEVLINYTHSRILEKQGLLVTKVIAIAFLLVGLSNTGKWYTGLTLLMTSALLMVNGWYLKPRYSGAFWLAYLIHLLPFAVVNGVLTALPVVTYNDAENLGIRMGTIPIEDAVYSLLLLLMNINLFEYFKQRKPTSKLT